MCTSADAASQGQDCAAGKGSHAPTAAPTRPAPTEMATVSSSLSVELLRRAFQQACSSAAPSTASVTGSDISTLAEHLLEKRRHALDRGAAFHDGFLGAVVVLGGKVGQERREQHVRR